MGRRRRRRGRRTKGTQAHGTSGIVYRDPEQKFLPKRVLLVRVFGLGGTRILTVRRDEGFHLLHIGAWDNALSLEILKDWVNLVDEDGWVGREQILGEEARSRVSTSVAVLVARPDGLLRYQKSSKPKSQPSRIHLLLLWLLLLLSTG